MNTSRITALFLVFLSFTTPLAAQSWTGELNKGGIISVDPRTNRGTIYTEQGTVPLWDGTHRLQDGSVVIVRDGVVTSGARPRHENAGPSPEVESASAAASSTCVELVIKTCGFNGECRAKASCSAARQLMQLEKDEAWQTRSKGPNETSQKCREALGNETFFERCDLVRKSDEPTACERLTGKVCGAKNACNDAKACSAAQQLLAMETQERLVSRDPNRPTHTSKQCLEALEHSTFFASCDAVQNDP